jgi:hypothetical protein
MESLLGSEDYAILHEGLKEVAPLTDRTVAIKRNSGFTGGTYDGTTPSPSFNYFYVSGTVESITQLEMTQTGGELALGDLKFTTSLDIREVGEGGGGYTLQEGDVLVYEGYEYRVFGKPWREYLAGGLGFTRTYWKRG